MSRQYEVLMTASAALFYKRIAVPIHQNAKSGNPDTRSVAAFRILEQAIAEIVLNPLDSDRALAGCFSDYYRYSLGRLRIVYSVWPEKHQIQILYIRFASTNLSEFIKKAVESGQLDGLIGQLGIDPGSFDDMPDSRYLN